MYITIPLSPRHPQVSLELLFDFDATPASTEAFYDPSATLTRTFDRVPERIYWAFRPERLNILLSRFVSQYADLLNCDTYRPHYRHYEIPKKNGKKRPIDDPDAELREAHLALKRIVEDVCPATHHANAYAYIAQRECKDAVEKHQKGAGHWFAKFDFTNFFGSTTPAFFFSQLREIYPFSWAYANGHGELIEKAFSCCFLDGGLPQGSSMSPLLTNLMMIPFDHQMSKTFRSFENAQYVYTRYADDIAVSCKCAFDVKKVERAINQQLADLGAPFRLNAAKTHYGSRSGRNWMLGMKLNADNNITVGYREKKEMRAMLHNYVMDRKHGHSNWDLTDIQQLNGKLSYYRHIEPEYFNDLLRRLAAKYGFDVVKAMQEDIKL